MLCMHEFVCVCTCERAQVNYFVRFSVCVILYCPPAMIDSWWAQRMSSVVLSKRKLLLSTQKYTWGYGCDQTCVHARIHECVSVCKCACACCIGLAVHESKLARRICCTDEGQVALNSRHHSTFAN